MQLMTDVEIDAIADDGDILLAERIHVARVIVSPEN